MADTFVEEFPGASVHEKFSIMLQERVLDLETELNEQKVIVESQQQIINQLVFNTKVCHIKTIFTKYVWQYSNITSSPVYYCKVLYSSLEMWCSARKIPLIYTNCSMQITEMTKICKIIFNDAAKIRLQSNLGYLSGIEQTKAKIAYLFSIMSIDELLQFDLDDTVPDLVEV